jgi:acetyl esterase
MIRTNLRLASRLGRWARTRVENRTIELAVRSAAVLARRHPGAARLGRGIEVRRDLRYGDRPDPTMLLDLYRPSGAGEARPLPVVLYVHGGGFRILSKDTHWMMALQFARAGFLVLNINYRLAPAHPFPAALQDLCHAYRWAVSHVGEYGGDANQLVIAGESAGANLVVALTLLCCYERAESWARPIFELGHMPRVVLPMCPLLQVSDPAHRLQARRLSPFVLSRLRLIARAYLGETWQAPTRTQELADPISLLERETAPDRPLPPLFASVGERDPIADDTFRLQVALERLRAPHEVRSYRAEGHAFQALWWREAAQICWREMLDFTRAQLSPSTAAHAV